VVGVFVIPARWKAKEGGLRTEVSSGKNAKPYLKDDAPQIKKEWLGPGLSSVAEALSSGHRREAN
jgi:hypothetical protein